MNPVHRLSASPFRPTASRWVPSIGLALLSPAAFAAASQDYAILPSTFDAAGGFVQSADYSVVHSLETSAIGMSVPPGDPLLVLHGYIPQLLDAASLAKVTGRWVFYNASTWDGANPGAGIRDDDAIAPDKTALLPGHQATFANYTSYSRGLNGIMVDVSRLPGTPTTDDFQFRVGNTSDTDAWRPAPTPASVTIRRGAGVGGSDRLTLIWTANNLDSVNDPHEAIVGRWLEVTVLATSHTGLDAQDVFYFGNAIGETGDHPADAQVTAADEALVRSRPRNVLNPAPITFPYDFNRDRRVDALDQLLARTNVTTANTALQLIAPALPTSYLRASPGSNARAGLAAAQPLPLTLTVSRVDEAHVRVDCDGEVASTAWLQWADEPASSRWQDAETPATLNSPRSAYWLVPLPEATAQRFFRVVVTHSTSIQ